MNTLPPPLVSIRCMVYNHEPFLRDCLEGFVMQQTNFPFEAIVHDDASTDNSAAIIREYAEKYPDIIKPIYETENQYSKKDGSLRRAMNAAMSPHSTYVAYCEGDDYWTDPHKLQKQVDFLEAHPDYSMCFHNAWVKWENREHPDELYAPLEEREYSGLELFKRWLAPTASMVVRRSVLTSDVYQKAAEHRPRMNGDMIIFLSSAACGKAHAFSEVMSVYRRHPGGTSYGWLDSYKGAKEHIDTQYAVIQIFGQQYLPAATRKITYICRVKIIDLLARGYLWSALEVYFTYLKITPFKAMAFTLTEPFSYLCRKIKKLKAHFKSN